MTEINRYSMMLEALAELKPKVDSTRRPQQPAPDQPSLRQLLAEFDPIPGNALFLGVASDDLPVLLNLHDPVPGPILLCGDSGTGKTAFLQVVATGAGMLPQPEDLQFGALTSHPDEWKSLESIPNNVGIFPLFHKSSEDFILSLASWAHGNKSSQQSVLLLIDDLEAATNLDFDAKQNLRWLFLRGAGVVDQDIQARELLLEAVCQPSYLSQVSKIGDQTMDRFISSSLADLTSHSFHFKRIPPGEDDLESLGGKCSGCSLPNPCRCTSDQANLSLCIRHIELVLY